MRVYVLIFIFVDHCSYKEYREKQEALHNAWLERKKEREEKLARGEKVGPEERDPTAEEEVGCLGLLKFVLGIVIVILLAGKFFTGSYLWEYDGQWVRLKTYFPVSVDHKKRKNDLFVDYARMADFRWASLFFFCRPINVYSPKTSLLDMTATIQTNRFIWL